VGNLHNVNFREWDREEFLELFIAVPHHGPITKRVIRTRYEKMLDDDLE